MKKFNFIGAVLLGSLALGITPAVGAYTEAGNTGEIAAQAQTEASGVATTAALIRAGRCEQASGSTCLAERKFTVENGTVLNRATQLTVVSASWDGWRIGGGRFMSEEVTFANLATRIIMGWARMCIEGSLTAASIGSSNGVFISAATFRSSLETGSRLEETYLNRIALQKVKGLNQASGIQKWENYQVREIGNQRQSNMLSQWLTGTGDYMYNGMRVSSMVRGNKQLSEYITDALAKGATRGGVVPSMTLGDYVGCVVDGCTVAE
jgi:hypothetical protein